MKQLTVSKILFPLCALLVLTPWVSSGIALFLGLVLALTLGNPYAAFISKYTHKLLSLSIIGLGAGMNLEVVAKAGMHGVVYTALSIAFAIGAGLLLGRALKTNRETSLLITIGTAICGGSAIAAVSPTIRAEHHHVSIALGTVFMLNAVALILFPWIGHSLDLTQPQFGLWSALAIHDTSSVVGATLEYGPKSLEIGTTVKLARALWILPLTFLIGFLYHRYAKTDDGEKVQTKKPWFILGFLLMSAAVTYIPGLETAGETIEMIARRCMVLTLFCIGAGLTLEKVKAVGIKPFLQGVLLWILVGSVSLAAVYYHVIG